MGLDVLVLPLSRYFAGKFQGPVEPYANRVGNPKPGDPELAARERARGLREQIERRLGRALDWTDEGETALSVQYHYVALQALRAYAAYREYPLTEPFKLDGSPHRHPSLMKIYIQNAPTRYRHLIDHSDCEGFYLPCDFPDPVPLREIVDAPPKRESKLGAWFAKMMMYGMAYSLGLGKEVQETRRAEKEERKLIEKLQRESPYPKPPEEQPPKIPRGKSLLDWGNVGSSVRLLAELDELNRSLQVPRDWGSVPDGETIVPEDDPWIDVKYGWGVLRYAARVSVEKRLPIVFDG
jgi:hypothetical protein